MRRVWRIYALGAFSAFRHSEVWDREVVEHQGPSSILHEDQFRRIQAYSAVLDPLDLSGTSCLRDSKREQMSEKHKPSAVHRRHSLFLPIMCWGAISTVLWVVYGYKIPGVRCNPVCTEILKTWLSRHDHFTRENGRCRAYSIWKGCRFAHELPDDAPPVTL